MLKRTILLALMTGGLAVWAAAADGPGPRRAPAPLLRELSEGPAHADGFDGRLAPSRKIQLALRVSGVIAQRPVAEGDHVKAGQLIAELNSDVEEAYVELARLKAESEHELQANKMAEEQAKVEFGRIEVLFLNQKAATEWELKKAKVDRDIAAVRTEYATYQRKVSAQEYELEKAKLKERRLVAPFDGIVWKTTKEAGEAVQELTPIAELVDINTLWVEMNLPVDQFGKIQAGQVGTVTIAGKSRDGKVIMVDPLVDHGSSTFRVRVELPNADLAFTAGLSARVKFQPDKAAATAPADADTTVK